MGALNANTVNELQKILLHKKNIVFLVLFALIPVFAALSFKLFDSRLGIFAVSTSNFPILMLQLFTAFLLPLLIFSLAADIFSGEIGEKTLKIVLTRPVTRFQVFLSKTLALNAFVILNLAIVYLVSCAAGLSLKGSGSVWPGFLQALPAYLTAVVPMLFLGMTAILIAQFFESSGGAVAACIFVYLAAKAAPFLSSTLAKINPFAYTDWYLMWLGSVHSGRIINSFFMLLGYSILFFSLGFYLFDKRSI